MNRRWYRSSPWMFDLAWPLGYAALAVVGFGTGYVARRVERRYIYTDD